MKTEILHLIASDPNGLTNMEIAYVLGCSYRQAQRATHQLHVEGKIYGRIYQWGIRSKVAWMARKEGAN